MKRTERQGEEVHSRVDGQGGLVLEPEDEPDFVPQDGCADIAGQVHRRALDGPDRRQRHCKEARNSQLANSVHAQLLLTHTRLNRAIGREHRY